MRESLWWVVGGSQDAVNADLDFLGQGAKKNMDACRCFLHESLICVDGRGSLASGLWVGRVVLRVGCGWVASRRQVTEQQQQLFEHPHPLNNKGRTKRSRSVSL